MPLSQHGGDRVEVADAMPNARLLVIPGDGAAEIAAIDAFLREPRADSTEVLGTEPGLGVARLTPRETEVLRLIAQGRTNR